jgi:hypothetical protein
MVPAGVGAAGWAKAKMISSGMGSEKGHKA